MSASVKVWFPGRLRQLRERRGWSQREAARRAGIAQPEWQRFELPEHLGGRLPRLERAEMMARALGIALATLLTPARDNSRKSSSS